MLQSSGHREHIYSMIPLSFDPDHFEAATSLTLEDTIIPVNSPSMTNWNDNPFRLLQLPNELILRISSFLDLDDLCRIRRQNRLLHALVTPQVVRWIITPYLYQGPERNYRGYKTSHLYRAIARPERGPIMVMQDPPPPRRGPDEEAWLTGRILSQCTPEQIRILSYQTHWEGLTLVAQAAAGCRLEILELLHKYGVDMTVPCRGWTPLHLVILRGNKPHRWPTVEKIMALLISAGADIEWASEERGHTPLQLAVFRKNVGATEVLIRAGADAWSTGKHKAGLNSVELARLVKKTQKIRQSFQELVFPGVKMLFSPRIRNRADKIRREVTLLAAESSKHWPHSAH